MSRQKHREEVLKLKQELQALQSTSKGGQQATDRTKKDLEKTRRALAPYLLLQVIHFSGLHWQIGRYHVPHEAQPGSNCPLWYNHLQFAMLSITAGVRITQPALHQSIASWVRESQVFLQQCGHLCGGAGRSWRPRRRS